jgi:hypothetical protein
MAVAGRDRSSPDRLARARAASRLLPTRVMRRIACSIRQRSSRFARSQPARWLSAFTNAMLRIVTRRVWLRP